MAQSLPPAGGQVGVRVEPYQPLLGVAPSHFGQGRCLIASLSDLLQASRAPALGQWAVADQADRQIVRPFAESAFAALKRAVITVTLGPPMQTQTKGGQAAEIGQ